MTIRTLAAAGAALLLTPSAAVHAQEYQASKIIENFDAETLEAVVKNLNATLEPMTDGGYRVTFSNGVKSTVRFTACSSGNCLGTNAQANFSMPDGKTADEMAKLALAFNKRRSAGKIIWDDEGNSGVQDYMIADNGITMGNYRSQLSLHATMAKLWVESVIGKPEGS